MQVFRRRWPLARRMIASLNDGGFRVSFRIKRRGTLVVQMLDVGRCNEWGQVGLAYEFEHQDSPRLTNYQL